MGTGVNVSKAKLLAATAPPTGVVVSKAKLLVALDPGSPPCDAGIATWLLVYEYGGSPATGTWVDQSRRLFTGQGTQHSFTIQARQRGTANYTLVVLAGDSYSPVMFQPIRLYDPNATPVIGCPKPVFAGIIQDFTDRYVGVNGDRYIDVTATSLESILDTVYVSQPMQFQNATCGDIVTALFNAFETGSFVSLGTIQAGATLALFNAEKGTKLSDILNQLAITSQFVWNVNPQDSKLFFGTPGTVAAPFSLTSTAALWDTVNLKFDGADYRNRQAVKLSFDAFSHSMEFFVGAGQKTFTLLRPVEQVVAAYVTLSTPNTATVTFSGQPSPGDTITIGPASQAWQATHVYALGGAIVFNGFVLVVTTAGTSGGSIPAFATAAVGDTTADNSVIWTNQGPLGLGTGQSTYTFVTALDNRQFGQILIGASTAATVTNTIDTINANASTRGTKFSLPTWENSQVNASTVSASVLKITQKAAGTGYVAALSTTSSAISFSSTHTTGGTSPQGSLGPNEGATISIQVYAQGTSTAAPGLAYQQGSAVITLATPLNSGSNLNVEYTRADGNVIEVENTALIAPLALITNGTGKYQQMQDGSQTGLIATNAAAGLQLAQEALAAFDVVPQILQVQTLKSGFVPGQEWTWALDGPLGVLLNGIYFIDEVRGELIEGATGAYLDSPAAPGAGHFRYAVKLIDTAQLASYMDFWQSQSTGGGGGGSGASLVATSGGAVSPIGTGGAAVVSQNDVTGSRALATVYQNTGTNPLYVGVSVQAGGSPGVLSVVSDSGASPTVVVSYSTVVASAYAAGFFIVLAGNYYKVTLTGGSLNGWIEWV